MNCSFVGCSASGDGGAIYFVSGGNKFLKVANLVIPADRILWIEIIPYDDENECDLVIKKKVNEFALEEEF